MLILSLVNAESRKIPVESDFVEFKKKVEELFAACDKNSTDALFSVHNDVSLALTRKVAHIKEAVTHAEMLHKLLHKAGDSLAAALEEGAKTLDALAEDEYMEEGEKTEDEPVAA